jgi:hypothetical protein
MQTSQLTHLRNDDFFEDQLRMIKEENDQIIQTYEDSIASLQAEYEQLIE